MGVRTRLSIRGTQARKIALNFHNVIDHIQMEISAPGEPLQRFTLGHGIAPDYPDKYTHQYLNRVNAYFKPGLNYQVLLMALNSLKFLVS